MTISLKHAFQSAKGDPADTTLVRPSNWNAEHTITLATDKLVGRQTAGSGAAEEITCTAAGRALLDDADAAAQRTTLSLGNVNNTSDVNKPVSTAQQAALDAAATQLLGLNPQTASYVAVLADAGKMVEMNVATANTFTIPPNASVAFPVKSRIDVVQIGAGQTTITAGVGVTLRNRAGLKLTGAYAAASLYKRGTDEWVVVGDLTT